VLKEQFGDEMPCRGVFSWDWELIWRLMAANVRWQHIDDLSFVFRLEAYPTLMAVLA
jgi:hypothetical protein